MATNQQNRQQGQRSARTSYSPILTKETTGRESPFKDRTIVHIEAETDKVSESGMPVLAMSFRGGKTLPGGEDNITHRQMRQLGPDGKPVDGNRFKNEPVGRRLAFNGDQFGRNVGQAVNPQRTSEILAAAQASGAYHEEQVFEPAMETAVDPKTNREYQRRQRDDEGNVILARDQSGNPIPKTTTDASGNVIPVKKVVAEVSAELALQNQNLSIRNPRPIQQDFPAYDPQRHFDPSGEHQAAAEAEYRKRGDYVHANAQDFEVKPSPTDVTAGRTQPFRFSAALEQNEITKNEVKLAKQSLNRAAKREQQAQPGQQPNQQTPAWGAPAQPTQNQPAQQAQQPAPTGWGAVQAQQPAAEQQQPAPLQSESSVKRPAGTDTPQYQEPDLG